MDDCQRLHIFTDGRDFIYRYAVEIPEKLTGGVIINTDDDITETICYCFKYTRGDIERDIRENGASTILERIIREKQFGNCRCSSLNPKGR